MTSQTDGRVRGIRQVAIAAGVSILGPLVPFLVGALGVTLEEEMGLTSGMLGLTLAVFFVVSAFASIPAGVAIERIGAVRSARVAGVINAFVLLALAVLVEGPWGIAVVMAVAGIGNAIAHPAVNGIISERVDSRSHGLTLGLKQAAIPGALVIAGLVVPLSLAVDSWRVLIAGLAAIGMILVVNLKGEVSAPRPPRRTLSREPRLALLGLVFAGGITAMNGGAAFLVPFGVDQGLSHETAGWVLVVGSLVGMFSRIVLGLRADRITVDPLRLAMLLLFLGSVGSFLMPSAFPWAVLVMCAGAWGWPGLLHLVVLRRYSANPAAATGVVEVGTYVGGALGPVAFGVVVDLGSYNTGWLLLGAASLMAAGVLAVLILISRDDSP